MIDLSAVFTEVAKGLAVLAAGWLKKVSKDLNAIFPKVRRLEARVEALENARRACTCKPETPPSTSTSTPSSPT